MAQGETSLQVLDSVECNNNCKMLEVFSAVGSVKTFFCIHRGDIKVTSRYEQVFCVLNYSAPDLE